MVSALDFQPMSESDDPVTYSTPQPLLSNRGLPVVGDDINSYFTANTVGTNLDVESGTDTMHFSFFERAPVYSEVGTNARYIDLFSGGGDNVNNTLIGKNRMKAVGDAFVLSGNAGVHRSLLSFNIANKYENTGVSIADEALIEEGRVGEFSCYFTIVENVESAKEVISINSVRSITTNGGSLTPGSNYPDTSAAYLGYETLTAPEVIEGDIGPIGKQWRKEFTGFVTPCNIYDSYIDPNSFHRSSSPLPANLAYGFIASGGVGLESKCALSLSVLGNFFKYDVTSKVGEYGGFEIDPEITVGGVSLPLPAPFYSEDYSEPVSTFADINGFINYKNAEFQLESTFHSRVVSAVVEESDGSRKLVSENRYGQYFGAAAVDPVMALRNTVQIKRYDSYQIATAGNAVDSPLGSNMLRQVKELFPSIPTKLRLAAPIANGSLLRGFSMYENDESEHYGIGNAVPAYVYELSTKTAPRLMANLAVLNVASQLPIMHSSQLYNTIHGLTSKFQALPVFDESSSPTADFNTNVVFEAVGREASGDNVLDLSYVKQGDLITGRVMDEDTEIPVVADYDVVMACTEPGAGSGTIFAMDFTTPGAMKECRTLAHTSYFFATTDS